MTVSEKIVRLMAQNGLTQMALSEAVGVAQRSVSDWVNGSRPRPKMIRKLADYFKIPTSVLIDDKLSLDAEFSKYVMKIHETGQRVEEAFPENLSAQVQAMSRLMAADEWRAERQKTAADLRAIADKLDPPPAKNP